MENELEYIMERSKEIIKRNKLNQTPTRTKQRKPKKVNIESIVNNIDNDISQIENEKDESNKNKLLSKLKLNLETLKNNNIIDDTEINNIISGL